MASKINPYKEVKVYPYPSRFGSHAAMIVSPLLYNDVIWGYVCRDEFGEYPTEKHQIDSNLADPNRFNRPAVLKGVSV